MTPDFWNDNTCRLEHLIYIPAANPGLLEEFIDDEPWDGQADLLEVPGLRRFAKVADENRDARSRDMVEFLTECLDGADGFLFQLARPAMQRTKKTGHKYYSWGNYHIAWLYAPSIDAIETVAAVKVAEWEVDDAKAAPEAA